MPIPVLRSTFLPVSIDLAETGETSMRNPAYASMTAPNANAIFTKKSKTRSASSKIWHAVHGFGTFPEASELPHGTRLGLASSGPCAASVNARGRASVEIAIRSMRMEVRKIKWYCLSPSKVHLIYKVFLRLRSENKNFYLKASTWMKTIVNRFHGFPNGFFVHSTIYGLRCYSKIKRNCSRKRFVASTGFTAFKRIEFTASLKICWLAASFGIGQLRAISACR